MINLTTEQFSTLLTRYLAQDLTADELDNFFEAAREPGHQQQVEAMLDDDLLHKNFGGIAGRERQNRIWMELTKAIGLQDKEEAPVITIKRNSSRIWLRVAAAAVVLLLLSVGGYFYFKNDHSQKQIATTQGKQLKDDVAPGSNKAILTLANGTQIILASAANGTLTQQGNTKVIKLDSGQLAYKPTSVNGEILYNTISTPRGGQYQIALADGSKVWLNAASSLKYPASFTGKERNVELTGEGYFEIAHNAKMPFHVKVNDMTVEVIGTHFNINAYADESSIKTTLLEGSVKVSSSPSPLERAGVRSDGLRLKPGEQSQLNKKGEIKLITNADIDREIAWKNSLFLFSGDDIQTIMRQISRWYDVEVEFNGQITDRHFTGVISRNNNVSEVLKMLEGTGKIKFQVEGKKIVVMR